MGLLILKYALECDKCKTQYKHTGRLRDLLCRKAISDGWYLYAEMSNLGFELVDCVCPKCNNSEDDD